MTSLNVACGWVDRSLMNVTTSVSAVSWYGTRMHTLPSELGPRFRSTVVAGSPPVSWS